MPKVPFFNSPKARYLTGTPNRQYTCSDVSRHSRKADLWVVIYDQVYGISPFLDEHPGAKKFLILEARMQLNHLTTSDTLIKQRRSLKAF